MRECNWAAAAVGFDGCCRCWQLPGNRRVSHLALPPYTFMHRYRHQPLPMASAAIRHRHQPLHGPLYPVLSVLGVWLLSPGQFHPFLALYSMCIDRRHRHHEHGVFQSK
jgi:hypothetical protein